SAMTMIGQTNRGKRAGTPTIGNRVLDFPNLFAELRKINTSLPLQLRIFYRYRHITFDCLGN
ncbi:MAG: hypothetical protein J7527_15755, partial [Chitinophagaceae bacterium]|nr:hypothetical protein [Chitinophagaceae bacterium]